MGLLDRFKNWECENCGKKYRKEPTECERCGHTIYKQV